MAFSLSLLLWCIAILGQISSGHSRVDRPDRLSPSHSFQRRVSSIGSARNFLVVAGTAALLYTAKTKVIDGPVFEEQVDLEGKNCVITGGNTGLGKETAIALASLGADVIILCKSPEKAELAVQDIRLKASARRFDPKVSLDIST